MGNRTLISIFCLIFSLEVMGAACCGGGVALPSLITGDYRAQLILNMSNSAVTHSANDKHQITKRSGENQEVVETMSLSGAYLISPYLQVGGTLPYKHNTHRLENREEKSSGIGDLGLSAAYEFLPEFSYSLWKPRGHIFLKQVFPTSNSTYDSNSPLRTDIMGNGFYTTSLGLSFIKSITWLDFVLMGAAHYKAPRTFYSENQRYRVTPRPGFSGLFAIGISPFYGNFRLGSSLAYSREGKIKITGDFASESEKSYYYEVGLSLSYLVNDYSIGLAYTDQAYLGESSNTNLTKTLALNLIRFFSL